MKGIVRSLIATKSFGFVRANGSSDYFFHKEDYLGDWDELVSDMANGIKVGVEFDDRQSPKGPRAANVRRD